MLYQIKSNSSARIGFSLIEAIVVVAILGILISVSTTAFSEYKSHENLEISTISLVEALRRAQGSAVNGRGDSTWGVKIIQNSVIIFKGADYLSRDTAFDQFWDISQSVSTSGLDEIVFSKTFGTTTSGTIALTNTSGTKNISINAKGTITY